MELQEINELLEEAKRDIVRVVDSHVTLPKIMKEFQEQWASSRQDYFEEVSGWLGNFSGSNGKALPYRDDTSLLDMQKWGWDVYRKNPTAQCIIEHLISFVIGDGHTYDVTPAEDEEPDEGKLKEIRRIIRRYIKRSNWQEFQEESLRRYFNSGERFRRIIITEGEVKDVDVRFIEHWEIRGSDQTKLNEKSEHEEFGIIKDKFDAGSVFGYWFEPHSNDEPIEGQRLEEWEIQHSKFGVDRNDPRGIPLLWTGRCELAQIQELTRNIHELAVLQTSIAMIVTSDAHAKSITDQVDTIVGRVASAVIGTDGRPMAGNTVVSGGEKFDFPAPKVNLENLIKAIRKDQAFLGNMIGMPVWMVSGDTSGANFASSVTSEGPMAKRIRREQKRVATDDQELIWLVVGVHLLPSEPGSPEFFSDLQDLKDEIDITANAPVITERDIKQLTEAVVAQINGGLESRRGACQILGKDYDAVLAGREAEKGIVEDDIMAALVGQEPPAAPSERGESGDDNPARGNTQTAMVLLVENEPREPRG